MLDHPSIQTLMSPAHQALRQRAAETFQAGNLETFLGPEGYLAKASWRRLGEEGFLAPSLPRELGGQGLGLLGAVIMNEAFSRLGDLGITLGMHVQNEITAYWLATTAQKSLRRRYLPELVAGRLVGCTCDTEPGGRIETTAERVGDELVIRGRKIYIVNGVNADLCFVSLLLDGEMATVLVEKDLPGVRILHVFDKLGTRAIDSALLEFDGVRVPATHVVSRRGVQQLMHWNMVMTRARLLISADAYFAHGEALARILAYGKTRQIGSRPLASWPINRHALARAAVDQALMRAGLVELFHKMHGGRCPVAEAAALKWLCVERAARFALHCAELQGGAGYMRDSPYLSLHGEILGLKMAGGSPTTMRVIANGALSCQEQFDANPTREVA